MEDKLLTAVRLHQSGRLAEAEALYKRVLSFNPKHPDALHFLGVLAGQAGQPKDAIQLIEQSIAVNPGNADAHANLGRILADQGNLEKSVAAYRRAAELRPADPSAWYALGIALRTAGDGNSALSAFENSIRLRPSFAEAYTEAGNLHRAAGRVDLAIEAHAKAVTLNPNLADAHNGLGNALLDKGKYDEAIAEFMSAVRLDPGRAVFHSNLGSALQRVERHEDSLVAYAYSIQLDPGSVDALTGRGIALGRLREYERAMQSFNQALELVPNHITTLLSMGEMYADKHDTQAANEYFQRALALDPQSLSAWLGVASARQADGKFEEAANYFRRALEIDPNSAIAYKGLGAIGLAADPELARLKRLLNQGEALPEGDRVAAGFAIGKVLDEAERYDEAFEHYAAANTLFRNMRARELDKFDGESLRLLVDRQIENFTPAYFSKTSEWGDPTDAPVFVVGMPRSGTTLVEQIAASHPKVFGAGELGDIGHIARRLLAEQQAAGGGHWTRESISREASAHLQRLTAMAPQAVRVVDKMPANILNLGLIADLFPNSRVILCQRDPRDICLSCYFQWFGKNSLIFSYDLEDCAMQYIQQQRLTEHWLKNLPLRMLPVQYEEMVNDLEGQSRRLIDFLGLEWDEKCLEFHKTKRTVSTASVWQVRQPIYTSSVGRWRHYEKHLGPLLAKLGM